MKEFEYCFFVPFEYFFVEKKHFFLYAPGSPPINSRVKNKQGLNFLSRLGLIASIENIKQNYKKILYSVVFTKPAL